MTDVATTHAEGCWAWGPKHHACAVREIERLRARAAEMERDLDACRVELLEAQHTVGEGWFADGATLAVGIARKCRMLEDDAEHWRKAAEARSLRAEDGDHALHRFAAIAAAKNEGRSAITLTVWSDGTVDAEQYATLEGELDEWGTLHQERRASWGSRPIGELDALVADLESDDWCTVEHRAPQDFWREIQALRARVAELEHEHDLSTSEGIRARIRELEAEVDVLTSELEVVEEAEAEEVPGG